MNAAPCPNPAAHLEAPKPGLIERILLWVFPHFDITKDVNYVTSLYLRRFYLTPRCWPWKIFLHHIVRGDDDRDPHDHQWDFVTFILRGCYLEHIFHPSFTPGAERKHTKRLAPAGTILSNKAEHAHRVEILTPVWSLVLIKTKRRNWGFWLEGKGINGGDRWVSWKRYLGKTGADDAATRAAR